MKNYEEMVRVLFERRKEYERQQKRKRVRMKRTVLCAAIFGVAAVGGLSIWKRGAFLQDSAYMQMASAEQKQSQKKQKENKAEKEEVEREEKKQTERTEDIREEERTMEDAVSSAKKKTQDMKKTGRDKRVTAVNPIDLEILNNGRVVVDEINCLTSSDGYKVSSDLDFLSECASEIVSGTVKEITYDVIEGMAWTKVDIQITDVFKGNLRKKDNLSVYRLGGYILFKEYEKYHEDTVLFGLEPIEKEHTLLKEVYEGEEFPEIGEKSVFYLSQAVSDSSLPKGAYERINGKYGELKTRKENENLFQYLDIGTKVYTWEEVRKKAEKWSKE